MPDKNATLIANSRTVIAPRTDELHFNLSDYYGHDKMRQKIVILTDVIIMRETYGALLIKDASDLGAAIRSRRKGLGLTQQELADACGCSIMYLSNLERGKETAELGIALRIVNLLGLDMTLSERGAY